MNINSINCIKIQPARKKAKAAKPKGIMNGRELAATNTEEPSEAALVAALSEAIFTQISQNCVKILNENVQEALKPSSSTSPHFISSELQHIIGDDGVFDIFRVRSHEWVVVTNQKMISLSTDSRDPINHMTPSFIFVLNVYPVRLDEKDIRETILHHPDLKKLVKEEEVHIIRGDTLDKDDTDAKVDWFVISESFTIEVTEVKGQFVFQMLDDRYAFSEMVEQGSKEAWRSYAEKLAWHEYQEHDYRASTRIGFLILQCLGIAPSHYSSTNDGFEIAFRKGDYDKVLSYYELPNDRYTESDRKDIIIPWCAAAYAMKQDYDLAIDFYTRSIQSMENRYINVPFGAYYQAEQLHTLYAERALVYTLSGDKTKALEDLHLMRTQEETILEIARNLGDLSLNPPSEAERFTHFLDLIEKRPSSLPTLFAQQIA